MMNSIMEGANNLTSENDDFSLRNDETSGCRLVETLEKNLHILRVEANQMSKINSDYEGKYQNFTEQSNSITSRLQSLITLSDLRFGDKNAIREFVEQITLSWLNTNKQMIKDHSRIRVASRTIKGTTLSVLLEKKKKEVAAIKISLEIGSVIYDQDYVEKGYRIHEEILRLLESLERCDDKVQQYMIMCKTSPYLADVSSAIDNFIESSDFSPLPIQSFPSSDDLSVFRFVSKLLTGELLDLEVTNPREILAENAPKKPVFITLNSKRKMNVPKISKIPRIASFTSSITSKYIQL